MTKDMARIESKIDEILNNVIVMNGRLTSLETGYHKVKERVRVLEEQVNRLAISQRKA